LLQVISNDDPLKWNKTVKSFKDHDVYYLAEYSKAFQIHGDGDPILFYFDNGKIRAINVVMKRDIALDSRFNNLIPENTYYDISTPYGYGGWLFDNVHYEQLFLNELDLRYRELCLDNNIICEFVRFHPILRNKGKLNTIYDITELGKTITINLNSKDEIWNGLSGKNRNVIRKAQKNDVKVYSGRSKNLFSNFKDIYNKTMDKDQANDYYYFNDDFYSSILNDLNSNSQIFYAQFDEKIISAAIILYANNQIHYHLSGSLKEFQHLAPTNLLLYEVACWGVDNGYKTLHLGGGLGSSEDSLFKFKQAFNKNSDTVFSIGKKIFNHEKYNQLIELRKQSKEIKNMGFFPLYRG